MVRRARCLIAGLSVSIVPYTFRRMLTAINVSDLIGLVWGVFSSAKQVLFENILQFSIRVLVHSRIRVLRKPAYVLIRKFPGSLGHPLTV